jgi:ribonucleoside-diphosphate reductase alpha chain
MCYTAEAVLAGGIRRSSLIALFSPDDTEMIYSKSSGNFRPAGAGGDPGLNAQREMANNSACLLRGDVKYETFGRLIRVAQESYGDPGFYFTNNLDYGPNPCGEIGMWPMVGWCSDCGVYGDPGDVVCGECSSSRYSALAGISFCNLTEVNCAAASSRGELLASVRGMAAIGTMQAAYSEFSYLGPVTEAIVRREALVGVGLTGIMDNRELVLDPSMLRECAAAAVAENQRMAALLGIRPAARVTTIKPSGTSSLELGGVGAGIHPRWARRYLHRITANPLEPQAAYFKRVNPHMVEEKPNGDWALVFPVLSGDGAVTVKEWNAHEFLDAVFMVYENWIVPGTARPDSAPGLTHNVSCTVTVRDGELETVIDRVWRERERVAAMTFVPYLIDKKFAFAPREAIEANDRWNHLIRLYKPIDWTAFSEEKDTTALSGEIACSGGACEVKF